MNTRAQFWQESSIDQERQAIKAELDAAAEGGDLSKRLDIALRKIGDLAPDASPIAQLRRYIYVVSALVHHERNGGLSGSQIRNLTDVALAILAVLRIKPGFSKAARLHGDLKLVLSQIHRKEGHHWLAAWEQQMAHFMARGHPSGGEGFQSLALANRALRLGHNALALSELDAAEKDITDQRLRDRVRFERVRAFRLARRFDDADRSSREALQNSGMDKSMRLEFEWEELCREVQRTGDLSRMLSSVKPNQSHHNSGYIIEASLWARIPLSLEWMEKMTKLSTAVSKVERYPKQIGYTYECALQLERCYDLEIPLPMRMEAIGQVLSRANMFMTVDMELLLWAAVARWLSRSKAFRLANLVLSEYQWMSVRLTDGQGKDSLGLLGDLFGREWIVNSEKDKEEDEPEA